MRDGAPRCLPHRPHLQLRPTRGRRAGRKRSCRPTSPPPSSPTPPWRRPRRSCAPACIAASAPRPARPTSCSATSSIRPRGRIYLIKDMLEGGKPATQEVVKHVDRCLSCLSCMTTCPSGVHYMHLVDHARAHIETTYAPPGGRPVAARPAGAGPALSGPVPAGAARRQARRTGPGPGGAAAAGGQPPRRHARPRAFGDAAPGADQPARPVPAGDRAGDQTRRPAARLRPERAAAGLQRGGDPPAQPARDRGDPRRRRAAAARWPITWARRPRPMLTPSTRSTSGTPRSTKGLDAILVTASGCGTTIKDYGFMFRDDPAYAEKARAGLGAGQGHHRVRGAARPGGDRRERPRGGLPLGLLDAARPEDPHRAEGAAQAGRLHRQGRAGGPHLLRLGRDLQHPAAGTRRPSCAPARSPTSSASAPT